MEKKKPAIAKSAKKLARVNIELSLTAHLNQLTSQFGSASKKLKKEIAKGAKKLAKGIAKELTFVKPEVAKTAPVAAAPAEKKPVATKAPVVAAPAKPAASKAKAVK